MSITRLRSRPAPAIDRQGQLDDGAELIIVAHGERGGAGDNRGLIDLAAAVGRYAGLAKVSPAVLKGEPSLERILSVSGNRQPHIYPMFMSDGHYVRAAIRQRVEAALGRTAASQPTTKMHRPFGLERGLAGMIVRHVEDVTEGTRAKTLVLVGHGSAKSGDSRNATEWQAARMRMLDIRTKVRTSYLENAPFLPDVLADLPAGPAIVVGFFSGSGQHGAEDIPAAIVASGRVDVVYAGPVGIFPGAATLIGASVTRNTAHIAES